MVNIEIIDCRDPRRVPQHLSYELFDYEHISTFDARLDEPKTIVYCWLIDGAYVPAVYKELQKQIYLCKTYSGFKKWLDSFYPLAYLTAGRKV